MKKYLLPLVLLFILMLGLSSNSFAAYKVVEKSGYKIFVNCKQVKLSDTPITVNNEILLSSNELLPKLGIPNDNKHIILDKSKKNLTIVNGSTQISLKADNNKATIGKSTVTLNTAPKLYKGKLYIPLKSISQILNKKYAWDEREKSAYIRELSEYNRVKAILDKAVTTTKSANKYKVIYTFDNKCNYTNMEPFSFSYVSSGKVDKKNKMLNMSGEGEYKMTYSNKLSSESYLVGNVLYTLDLLTDKWEKETLSAQKANEWINDYDISKFEITSDVLYCGMMIEENQNNGTVKLKGNVFTKVKGAASESVEPVNTYTEIEINSSTNLINKLSYTYNDYESESNIGRYLSTTSVSATYSDYNGNYELIIPEVNPEDFSISVPEPLTSDEEKAISALASKVSKEVVVGGNKNPYGLEASNAIVSITLKDQGDFNTFNNLSFYGKQVFINQIVQENYSEFSGCDVVIGMVVFNDMVYDYIITGYEIRSQNVYLDEYKDGKSVKNAVQDAKNSMYTDF